MSLITRCPSCGTAFRVVRDQLKISDGWVRCGQCLDVFDSTPNLREVSLDEATSPLSAPAIAADIIVDFDPTALVDAPVVPRIADADADQPERRLENAELQMPGLAPPASAIEATALVEVFAVPIDAAASIGPAFTGRSASAEQAAAPVESMPEADVPPSPQPADFSFVAQAAKPTLWQSAWVRWGLVMACLVLVGLLFLQVVIHERDRIVAHDARARPAMQRLCDLLECEIRPMRMIESISVESSSFNKLRADTFRLVFTLRNTGQVPVAQPAIELTLTDTQDAPLVRRVLLPADLDFKAEVLPAGAEQTGTYLVSVSPAAGAAGLARNIAGYRVLAFYP